jgi:RimJ/RimL family protein N-acetyltransferase
MRFVEINKDNWLEGIRLRVKRSQYGYVRREAVLYSIAKTYVHPQGEYTPYLIEEDGRFVGSIRLRNYGYGVGFAAFFIDRKHQGKGLARKALQHMIEFVRSHYRRAKEIETAVHCDNEIARRLYEAVGFHCTGVETDGFLEMEMQLGCQQAPRAGGEDATADA